MTMGQRYQHILHSRSSFPVQVYGTYWRVRGRNYIWNRGMQEWTEPNYPFYALTKKRLHSEFWLVHVVVKILLFTEEASPPKTFFPYENCHLVAHLFAQYVFRNYVTKPVHDERKDETSRLYGIGSKSLQLGISIACALLQNCRKSHYVHSELIWHNESKVKRCKFEDNGDGIACPKDLNCSNINAFVVEDIVYIVYVHKLLWEKLEFCVYILSYLRTGLAAQSRALLIIVESPWINT